jgi:hypothetical protein
VGFYESKQELVHRSLTKYGMDAYLVVPGVDVIDPVTGGRTAGSASLLKVRVLNGDFNQSRKGGTEIHARSRSVYMSPVGVKVKPSVSHMLRVGGLDYQIMQVSTVDPGGVAVLYQLQVQLP